jgi:cation diffusion facilitator CzcD-associated flavoprotein CzcO
MPHHILRLAFAAKAATAATASAASPTTSHQHHKFCVVGAGGAGIQLTAHLAHDQQDVLLIERSDRVGSTWETLPISRSLRSIYHTTSSEDDFDRESTASAWANAVEERNDHVSLLSPVTGRVHPFKSSNEKQQRKRRGRVDANDYQSYLEEYVEAHSDMKKHLKLSTNVDSISKKDGRFTLALSSNGGLTCEFVVWYVTFCFQNMLRVDGYTFARCQLTWLNSVVFLFWLLYLSFFNFSPGRPV